jgi:hypothetical protein
MSWLFKSLLAIALFIFRAAEPHGVFADEKPLGVAAEFATDDGSALTHVAVRSEHDIFLANVRGEVLGWNPETKTITTWRKADGKPLVHLQSNGDGSVFVQTGPTLEIASPTDEIQTLTLPHLTHLAISPTGGQLAASAEEPPIIFLNPKSGETTHRVDRQVWVDEMHYSPTGEFLATSRYGRLYLWNTKSGGLVWKTRLEGNLKGFTFPPDQSVIFASFGALGLWVIDIKKGNLIDRHSRPHAFPEEEPPHLMSVSPDGMLLAMTVVPDRIEIWETFTGRPILLLAKHPAPITDLEFLPDGAHLVSADQSGQAYFWDLSAPEFAAPLEVDHPYSEDQLRQLWRMLGEPEGHTAWSALVALKHRPEQAMELILDPPNDDVLIRQLIQRLDDDEFSVREAAFRALRQLSLHAEPLLQKTLSTSRSAEVKVRVRRLLSYLAGPRREAQLQTLKEAQMHRELRVVQLLKWMGTEEAVKRLETLRDSAELPAVQKQAETSLRFLQRKMNPKDARSGGTP